MSIPSLLLSFVINNLQSKTKIVLRHYYVEITQYILQTEQTKCSSFGRVTVQDLFSDYF